MQTRIKVLGQTLADSVTIWEGDMPGFVTKDTLILIEDKVRGRVHNVSVIINKENKVGQVIHIHELRT